MGVRFTEKERSRLRRFKARYHANPAGELEDKLSTGIPLITKYTTDRLREVLSILPDGTFDSVKAGLNSEECESPAGRLMVLAQSYTRELQDKEKAGVLGQISSWAKAVYRDVPNKEAFQNAAFYGTVLTMEACRLEFGQVFIDNLKLASPQELMRAFDKFKTPVSERGFLLDRVKNLKEIPSHQFFLHNFVEMFQHHHVPPVFGFAVEDGICTMYHVVNELWPHLKPSPQS